MESVEKWITGAQGKKWQQKWIQSQRQWGLFFSCISKYVFFFAHFVPVLFARLVVRHYAATALFIEIASGLYLTTWLPDFVHFFNGFQANKKPEHGALKWRIRTRGLKRMRESLDKCDGWWDCQGCYLLGEMLLAGRTSANNPLHISACCQFGQSGFSVALAWKKTNNCGVQGAGVGCCRRVIPLTNCTCAAF